MSDHDSLESPWVRAEGQPRLLPPVATYLETPTSWDPNSPGRTLRATHPTSNIPHKPNTRAASFVRANRLLTSTLLLGWTQQPLVSADNQSVLLHAARRTVAACMELGGTALEGFTSPRGTGLNCRQQSISIAWCFVHDSDSRDLKRLRRLSLGGP